VAGPLTVPPGIARPPYIAAGGIPSSRALLPVTTPEAAERMRAAGRAARRVLDQLADVVAPGVTTHELDVAAHEAYRAEGGYPSTLGYGGYPKRTCPPVNGASPTGTPDDGRSSTATS
jgi:methionyl aminopeptidase